MEHLGKLVPFMKNKNTVSNKTYLSNALQIAIINISEMVSYGLKTIIFIWFHLRYNETDIHFSSFCKYFKAEI